MRFWNYWKANVKLIKDDFTLVVVILAIISFLTALGFYIYGSENPYSKFTEHTAFFAGIVFVFIGLVLLPPKRHQETESAHLDQIKDLISANVKLIDYLKSEHTKAVADLKSAHNKEADILNGEIQKLKNEIAESSKIQISADLITENHGYERRILKIRVVNNSNKVLRVEKVAAMLMPHSIVVGGVAIYSDTSEITAPQTSSPVEIKTDADVFTWQILVDNQPLLLVSNNNSDKFGKGYVLLTTGAKLPFEFFYY